jgi:hypothetical protein
MKHSGKTALMVASIMIAGSMIIAVDATAWGEIDEEGIFETVEDFDDDGKINYLVINVPIQDVSWYGSFWFRDFIAIDAQLWDETDTVYIGSFDAEHDIEEDSESNQTVQVRLSGRMIHASEVDGPYLVKMWITHYVTDYFWPGMPIISESLGYVEYVTEAYTHDDFETPDPYTISRGWEVVDDDENGLYDWLRVNLTVNATDGDIVEISLELSAEVGPDLITYSDQRTLDAGYNQTVYIDIDGRLMNGLAREDTWYWIYIRVTTLDGFYDRGWVSTDSLNASDFEEYVISVVDGPVWTMVDVDDDGLYDFLRASFNTSVQDTLKYRLRMRLSDDNSYWASTQYFDGYLLAGFEETVVVYFDVSDMFDYAPAGPFNLEIHEQPATYNKWPGYDYIEAVYLDNLTIEELDIEQLNHPDTIFVSGYITDEEGGPIAGAEVYALARDSWDGYAIDFSTTDVDGMYNLTELIPGLIMISVQAVGYFTETFYTNEIVSNTTDFNLTLEPNSPADTTIWGTVFDIEGDPVADAVVALLRPGSGVASQTTSNETGDYSLDIRAGDYVIEAVYQDLGIGSSTVSIGLTLQWVSLPQGSSINNDITLNITYDGDIEDIYDLDRSRSLWFESWDSLSMRSDLTQNRENDILSFLYVVIADVDLGNADGYVDEEENAFIQSMFGGLYSIFMGEPQSTSRCEWYTLGSFSVDGIGYLAQPDDVQLTSFDLTGSVWETEQEFSMRLDVVDLVPHWPIPEDETHELYLEVEYASEIPLSLTYTNRYYITAPEGFILNSTNEPENIEIDGLNHVTIVPGDSPDPDNVSSALVVLEFRRETGPGVGSVHGVALLQGETNHAGIEIALLDRSLTILDQMTTGSTGEFAFPELDPGSYWVRANFSGYIDVYAEVTVTSEEIAEVNLELLPVDSIVDLGGISGRVVTQAGLPLEGATVNLYSPVDDDTPVMTEVVGADGEFEFSDLESGEFKLEISADGFDNRSIYLMLNTGDMVDLGNIELLSDMAVGYITGILESSDNESIVGVTVEVRASGSDTVLADGETNSDGVFLLTGLDDGDYNLTFILDGDIIGYAEVEVEDFVGDTGRIVIDLSDVKEQGVMEQLWPWILLLAIVAVAAVAAALMKLRKPKGSQPMKLEETEEIPAEQE